MVTPRTPSYRSILFAFAALVLSSFTWIHAQTCIRVTPYGQAGGVPASLAQQFDISIEEDASGQVSIELAGGTPGTLSGFMIGATAVDVPIFGSANLLVIPYHSESGIFDANGKSSFPVPIAHIPGIKYFVQALHIDMTNPVQHFIMSEGLELEVVPALSRATEFDLDTAKMLESLSNDAYLTLTPGQTLTGGWEVVATLSDPGTSTHLFVARNAACDLAVSFRGTTNIQNWLTNLNIAQQNGFHAGFLQAFQTVEAPLRAELLSAARNSHGRVFFTGHSLGGALATVASYHLAPDLTSQRGFDPNDIVMYSFGAPRSTSTSLAPAFETRVPHSFAVASIDDIVTHVPYAGYQHIQTVRSIYPFTNGSTISVDKFVLVETDGYTYDIDPIDLTLVPPAHAAPHSEYTHRLHNLHQPSVSLGVSQTGYMDLRWSNPERNGWDFGSDFVALFRGDPRVQGTNGYLTNQWQWASTSGTHTTGTPKGRDLYVAYIQQRHVAGPRQIVEVWGPYESPTEPQIWLSVSGSGHMQLNLNFADPGAYDWIGLFRQHPTDPSQVLSGSSWQWAVNGSYATNWAKGDGFYMAYVEQESRFGTGRITKIAGPYRPSTPRLSLDYTSTGWLRMNWSVADPGAYDFVALYDRNPYSAGTNGYLSNQWQWALGSSSWTTWHWGAGYYMAYIQMDGPNGTRRILATAGPSN